MMTQETRYEVHEWAANYPDQTAEETARLKENMLQRATKGLEPLESPILLVDGKIADGRHRYRIWNELAEEGVCGGYFSKHKPPVEEHANGQDSEVALLLRITSRNICNRTLTAGQRAAIFALQIEKSEKLKQFFEDLRIANEERMKAGKPSDESGKSTNAAMATMANVSEATMKQAKAVLKEAPEKLADVVNGTTSLNKAVKDVKTKSEGTKNNKLQPSTKSPRKPPIDLGPKKIGEKVIPVSFDINSADLMAQVREMFEDIELTPKRTPTTKGSVFTFNASATDLRTFFTSVANIVAGNGPRRIGLKLE